MLLETNLYPIFFKKFITLFLFDFTISICKKHLLFFSSLFAPFITLNSKDSVSILQIIFLFFKKIKLSIKSIFENSVITNYSLYF